MNLLGWVPEWFRDPWILWGAGAALLCLVIMWIKSWMDDEDFWNGAA